MEGPANVGEGAGAVRVAAGTPGIADRTLRATRRTAGQLDTRRIMRKLLRQDHGTIELADWRRANVAHAIEIGAVQFLIATQVIGQANADLVVVATLEVVAQPFSGGEEGDIPSSRC